MNNVPIIGKRKVRMGTEIDAIEVQIPQEAGASALFMQATQAVKQALEAQGQFAVAQQAVNPFQFEPTALAVFVAAADEISRLRAEVEELRARLDALLPGDPPDRAA